MHAHTDTDRHRHTDTHVFIHKPPPSCFSNGCAWACQLTRHNKESRIRLVWTKAIIYIMYNLQIIVSLCIVGTFAAASYFPHFITAGWLIIIFRYRQATTAQGSLPQAISTFPLPLVSIFQAHTHTHTHTHSLSNNNSLVL